MTKLSVSAPGKINWFLSVLGKRPDGYHDISSVMQLIGLSDVLELEASPELSLESDLDLPEKDNLVYRAAELLRLRSGYPDGAKMRLIKSVPAAAGLGGGSSDAAAALAGLNRLWGLGLGSGDLMRIGSEIGSDVPFFLSGPFAHVSGRGEQVSQLPSGPSFPLLLVKPPVGVSTAWAYGALEKLTKKVIDIKLFCHAFDRGDFGDLRHMAVNDLEGPVIRRYPVVGEIKRRLIEAGAVFSAMSGSGPTVFGVFSSVVEAREAAKLFHDHWHAVTVTLRERSEP